MSESFKDERLKKWILDYGYEVLSTAKRITGNVHDAEDVFQNTFIKAYCRNKSFKSQEHIKAWLIRVTINDCISRLRSGWKKRVVLCKIPEELCEPFNSNDTIQLLKKLPNIYRQALWLHYWAGYKTHEIADMVGVSPATIRTRLKRARERKTDMQGSNNYE